MSFLLLASIVLLILIIVWKFIKTSLKITAVVTIFSLITIYFLK